MVFVISFYQYQLTSIPDTMAELPTPMLLIILMSFTNGGIVPLLIGTITYHTPSDKRGIMLGVITFVMSGATLLSSLFFQWANKLFTPGVLLALMTIPLAFVMILSNLFINDLRKSTYPVS
jgi:MFS family permease